MKTMCLECLLFDDACVCDAITTEITKRIERAKRRLREARKKGDATKSAAIEKEIRMLRQEIMGGII